MYPFYTSYMFLFHTHSPAHCLACVLVLRHFGSVQLFAILWALACQAPLSMGILQARILEWVAMPSSRGSCQPRDWTQVSCIAGEFITVWVTREAKNTGVGSLSLFQGIFLTQESSGGGVGGSPALQADSLPAELPGNYICFRYTT